MFRKALRDITSRKMRTLLVVLSVAIGVFGVSAVGNLSKGLSSAINLVFDRSKPADITILTSPVDRAIVDQLRQVENVTTVEDRLSAFAEWSPKGSPVSLLVVGMRDFAKQEMNEITLSEVAVLVTCEMLFEKDSLAFYSFVMGDMYTYNRCGK